MPALGPVPQLDQTPAALYLKLKPTEPVQGEELTLIDHPRYLLILHFNEADELCELEVLDLDAVLAEEE
jgi:hypothetical protein